LIGFHIGRAYHDTRWNVTTMKIHNALMSIVVLFAICAFAVAEEGKAKSDSAKSDAPKADSKGWYNLFNGKDLAGWKKAEENEDTIKVVDGEIVIKGPRCHLFYAGPVKNADFKNFRWKCELLTKPHANSGMYFHTEYQQNDWPKKGIEVQVNNTHGDPRKTASLYRIKDVMNDAPAKDNEWFTQEVIVKGKHVVVKINGKKVNEWTQPDDFEREAGWEHAVISTGTFALQGHDPDSEIHYRKVLVKPLPDDAGEKSKKDGRGGAKRRKRDA
jgi:hypothetical protein